MRSLDIKESAKVSVIIVNYNSGHYLGPCLHSVKAQTFREIRIVIVDNASSDGSLDILEDFRECVVIRNERNLGFAAAQNQGMRAADSEYVMPLNFDIELAPDFLEQMVKALESSPRHGTASGKMLKMHPDGRKTEVIDNAGLLLPPRRVPLHRGCGEADNGQYDQPDLVFGAMGAAALYKREMLEDVAYQGQFFDESYFMWYEDIDLDWRARSRGWDCVYAPAAVAYHVGDPHGHGRSRLGAEISIRNRWRMIASNECSHCLVRNIPWLLAEEAALLIHVLRQGLLRVYLCALRSFLESWPATLAKRRWVRGHAVRRCLPDYPLPLSGG